MAVMTATEDKYIEIDYCPFSEESIKIKEGLKLLIRNKSKTMEEVKSVSIQK